MEILRNLRTLGLGATALLALAPFGALASGCGSSGHASSGAFGVGSGGSGAPSPSPSPFPTPTPSPSPSSGGGGGGGVSTPGSTASITGSVTRVNGASSNLAGIAVAAVASGGPVLATVTTDSLGGYTLTGLRTGVEIELEIGNADPDHAIHLPALEAGEHASARSHVSAGLDDDFACAGPNGFACVHVHLAGATVSCDLDVRREQGLTHATIDSHGSASGSTMHLVDSISGTELGHGTAASDGSCHFELESELEGELELRDDSGATLASGTVPTLPSDDSELESRERGSGSLVMNVAGSTGTLSDDSDSDGDHLEIEVEHLAPGAVVDVRFELQPGVLSSIGTITADGRGHGRIELTSSSLGGPVASLHGRRIELDDSTGAALGSGAVPDVTPDF